jgi:hypothetical protein
MLSVSVTAPISSTAIPIASTPEYLYARVFYSLEILIIHLYRHIFSSLARIGPDHAYSIDIALDNVTICRN